MSEDMLRADARLRRQTLIALGLASAVAVVALFFFQRWLSGIGAIPGTDLQILRLRQMIGIGLTGSAICLALLAWYAVHQASRVKATGQWPTPGTRVIRDTPIRRGNAARQVTQVFQATALVLLMLAFALGYASVQMLSAT
ncbi:hypothetical protein [Dokdonella sp.]|uniref:hypothetical protein n=1 Tax=Dokdonella sp. TaxID=2291710 RepID=UPI003529B405